MDKNLTSIFLDAIASKDNWHQEEFDDVITQVRDSATYGLNWDSSVPELWIGITLKTVDVAVIRKNLPVGFVLKDYVQEVKTFLDNFAIRWIEVDSFQEHGFSLDEVEVALIFPDKFSDVIEIDNFSVAELCYGTM